LGKLAVELWCCTQMITGNLALGLCLKLYFDCSTFLLYCEVEYLRNSNSAFICENHFRVVLGGSRLVVCLSDYYSNP
jgi:hypothetical protein